MVETLESSLLQKLKDYWDERRVREGHAMPVSEHVDLLDLPYDVLPFSLYVEVRRDMAEPRFRFRYVGQEIVRRYGEDPTNRYLDELDFGDQGQAIREDYTKVTAEMAPHRFFGEMRKRDGRWLRFERLLLPFSRDGERVDMVVAGIVHEVVSKDDE